MGVTGSGKTSTGEALAARLGVRFVDADDQHSPEAKAKMARGEGLTDADRAPWLARLRDLLATEGPVVLACSALKRTYRDTLRVPGVRFVYLQVPQALLNERLSHRRGHYAKANLLPSQLVTLEEPALDEGVLTLPVGAQDTPDDLAARAQGWLRGVARAPA